MIKFVPKDSKVANKSALPDAEIPVTATMAAIPILIPIDAVSYTHLTLPTIYSV